VSNTVCATCGTPVVAGVACIPCGSQGVAYLDELAPGVLLHGRYQVVSVLGRGGFGVTYRAFDTHLERVVAIKEMFPEGSTRSGNSVRLSNRAATSVHQARAEFLLEARTLARFRSPAIVHVYEAFEEFDTAYVVMEFLDGRTYYDVMAQTGPLAGSHIEQLLVTVGGALSRLHAEGILHRDVKPANVMFVEERPVLIDFGASRSFVADLSQDMSRLVTAGYSPLEQYSGHARFGPKTDVYALAATAYHLATGVAPVDAVLRAQGAVLENPATKNPTVSPALDRAIMAGMAQQPAQRPDMAEFLAFLANDTTFATGSSARTAPNPAEPSPSPKTVLVSGPIPITQTSTPNSGTTAKAQLPKILVGVGALLAAVTIGYLLNRPTTVVNAASNQVVTVDTTTAKSPPPTGVAAAPNPGVTNTALPTPQVTTIDAEPTATVADLEPSPAATEAEIAPAETVTQEAPSSPTPDTSAGSAELVNVDPIRFNASAQRASVRLKCTGALSTYGPNNLFDNDPDTGWGVSKTDGSGESVTAVFAQPVRLRRISMTPGFLRYGPRSDQGCDNVNAFGFNRFVTAVRYETDNGSFEQRFTQDATDQGIDVDVTTAKVTMVILGTSRVGTDDDTIISDLSFFAQP
jgi:serine/threonine protein kinase